MEFVFPARKKSKKESKDWNWLKSHQKLLRENPSYFCQYNQYWQYCIAKWFACLNPFITVSTHCIQPCAKPEYIQAAFIWIEYVIQSVKFIFLEKIWILGRAWVIRKKNCIVMMKPWIGISSFQKIISYRSRLVDRKILNLESWIFT